MGVFQIVTGCLIIKYIKWFAYGAAKRIDGLLLVQLSALALQPLWEAWGLASLVC